VSQFHIGIATNTCKLRLFQGNSFLNIIYFYKNGQAGADPGGHTRRPPPKIGKNMIFWRKIVIFHTKYPNNFRASLRSAIFFMCSNVPGF
jgi:hypothetical protein